MGHGDAKEIGRVAKGRQWPNRGDRYWRKIIGRHTILRHRAERNRCRVAESWRERGSPGKEWGRLDEWESRNWTAWKEKFKKGRGGKGRERYYLGGSLLETKVNGKMRRGKVFNKNLDTGGGWSWGYLTECFLR